MLTSEEIKKRQKTFKPKGAEEKDKVFLMWSGVIFFMLLIFFLWAFNIKTILGKLDGGSSGEALDINKIANQFYESVDELSVKLDSLNSEDIDEVSDEESVAPQAEEEIDPQVEEINKLKEKIEEAENTLSESE